MSWAEIKKSINSTVGTSKFKALDDIEELIADDIKYDIADTLVELMGGESETVLIVQYGVEEIGFNEYQGSTFRKIVMPTTVKHIGGAAFFGAENLKSILIPNSVETTDGAVFSNCTALKSVKIPKSLKKIGHQEFSGCISLKNVDITEGVQEIGFNAFGGCTALKNIYIPKSIKSIESLVFEDCANLTDIYIASAEGTLSGAPWGAPNAQIHYNS